VSTVFLNRIRVIGRKAAVAQFRTDACRRLPGRRVDWTGSRSVPLSFEKLFRLHAALVADAEGPPSDTGHYLATRGRITRWHRYYQIEYSLELTNYELHELVQPLSRGYPHLVFIVSELCGDDGGLRSSFLHRGRCRQWSLPERAAGHHWRAAADAQGVKSLDDAYEDDLVRWDAERRMIDEGLRHWDSRLAVRLDRVVRRRR
jgi:hypothetical protein